MARDQQEIDDILNEARERFDDVWESERSIRMEALADLKFRTGDQWDGQSREVRESDSRPILTLNLIKKFVAQLANEQRQQRSAIIVSPIGNALGFDPDQAINIESLVTPQQTDPRDAADIWQGLIRHIEVRSDADTADATAFENAVGNSFGFIEIDTEYAGPHSFDQEIRIKRVLDPFAIFLDPNAQEPDRSDMEWAFVRETMTREAFKRLYPKSNLVAFSFYDESATFGPGENWVTQDNVYVCKYWRIVRKDRKLLAMSAPADKDSQQKLSYAVKNFRIDYSDQDRGLVYFTCFEDEMEASLLPEGTKIENSRTEPWGNVEWFKITGKDILDEGGWAGKYIPLVPVYGEEVILQGKRMLFSITRFLRDPQRLYNFFRSQQAEVVALSPKPPFIGAVGQFKTKAQDWQKANLKNYAYLEYDPVPVGNGMAPPPARNAAEPPIAAVNQACAQSSQELMEVSGIYPPALGERSNETSGRAIYARQQESNNTNFHFLDNFRRAKRHVGRILMDLIPHIYDRANRIIRIVKPDDQQELITINASTRYKGRPAFFDAAAQDVDISVQVGPQYQTVLQQTFDMLSQIIQANPNLFNVFGDLLLRASPLPGHIGVEAAKRMQAMLDPRVQQLMGTNERMDPAVAGQMGAMQQKLQEQQQIIVHQASIISGKLLELESKERIATETNVARILAAEVQSKSAEGQHLAQLDHDAVFHRMELHDAEEQRKADAALAAAANQQQPSAPAAA